VLGRGAPSGASYTPRVQVDVVGVVSVRAGDRRVSGHALGGRRARVALVVLALNQGPVSAARLAEALWPDSPPPSWQAALRGVIRALRTSVAELGLGGQDLVVTAPNGYALAPGIDVDVILAATSVAAAETYLAAGRHRAALAAVDGALSLEGSDLLPDEDLPWLDAHRKSVDDTRRRALEIVAAAAGALGEHHRAIQAARQAVSSDPMDERAHRALIQALDRAGDRAGAVLAFEECRSMLAEQLGVDPSRETVEVYLAVLRDQPQVSSGRLPATPTSFVGREVEVAELRAALQVPGLVTVTGKGGVGKSRLALQAATGASFAGGRFWVSLNPVSADELVASAVMLEIGAQVGAGDPAEGLAAHLAPLGPVLLVLDGSEAVLDGVASLVAGLLEACPLLTLLVTSRLALSLDGERIVNVTPLPQPDTEDDKELARSPQVQLLADRVRVGGGELRIDSRTAPLIALLCLRCGGLPLALELVAAQLTAMSIGDLLDHLSEIGPDEDDQVRAVLAQSYALLDPAEAEVFRTFAVLDGPISLPLIRQVVSDARIAPVRVIRILRELTSRGLLSVDRSGPRWRYQQDDDVHGFAGDLLRAEDGESAALTRLGQAILGLLPEDARQAPGSYQGDVTEALGSIRSFLGAAVDGRTDRARGLEIAFRLHRYWAATDVAEGRFWLSRLLADSPETPWTGYATFALGYLSYWSGAAGAAVRELESAVVQLRGLDDAYAARALIFLGGLADDLDRGAGAVEFQRQAIEATDRLGAPDLRVSAVAGMAGVLAERVDAAASGFAAEAITLCRNGGSAEQLAATLPMAAMVCWQVGDLVLAREFVREGQLLTTGRRIAHVVLLSVSAGLALADGDAAAAADFAASADAEGTDLGVERELPLIRCLHAWALLRLGDVVGAAGQARSALRAAASLSYTWPHALCLETSAVVAQALGSADQEALVRLVGCADAIRTKGDRPPPPSLRADLDALRAQIGPIDSAGLSPLEASALAVEVLAIVSTPA
jgi:predicted ATPase/DNA-binding SARP family transcriptional activator